ncbi:MAG: hypothetical protein HZY76_16530 [Anaerolineae bacterium]|nr:MAG: hypothetical protein HZY76_16530 [Anaerolineae bacterium]
MPTTCACCTTKGPHAHILDGLAWLRERAAADPDATAVVYYRATAGSTNRPNATT